MLWRRYGREARLRGLSIAVDSAVCLLLAWIPAETDPILALYPMFFATAVQWVAYSQAAGYSAATIFSTNNLRQFTEGVTEYLCAREPEQLRKLKFFGGTLVCFHLGVAWGWWCTGQWGIPGIYGCLPLLAISLPGALARKPARL